MLGTFPTNVPDDAPLAEHRDNVAVLVRKATAFIDDNAYRDISPADIAAAAHVTPDVLNMLFHAQHEMSPSDYLRKVRMHHARAELAVSDPASTTVATIARRWGFGNLTRFAIAYRLAYGESPRTTLNRT